MFSFPPGTEMVQFPGSPLHSLCIELWMTGGQTGRVTPFGHPRISGCVLLPAAFRSLPRPSSYSSSKASSMDPFSLDHISYRPLRYTPPRGAPCTPSDSSTLPLLCRSGRAAHSRAQASLGPSRASGSGRSPLRSHPVTLAPLPRLSGHRVHSALHPFPNPCQRSFRSWRYGDLNPRPMACKATALATELYPLVVSAPGGAIEETGRRGEDERKSVAFSEVVLRKGTRPPALPLPRSRSRESAWAAGGPASAGPRTLLERR